MTFARTTFFALAAVLVSLFAATGASALTLDQAFGTGGIATVPATKGFVGTSTREAVARPGGGYLVAGSADSDSYWENTWMVTAFTADGQPDPGFGNAGRAMLPKKFGPKWLRYSPADAIAVQPDGKILVGSTIDVATRSDNRAYWRDYGDPECNCSASRAAFAVIRLTPNGQLDTTYAHHGLALIRSVVRTWDESLDANLVDIAIDSGGGAIVYGNSTDAIGSGGWDGRPAGLVYRLGADGWIDKTFGNSGRILEVYSKRIEESQAISVGVDATGAITTASDVTVSGKKLWQSRWLLRKYTPAGAAVAGYALNGSNGIKVNADAGAGLADAVIAPDGSATLGGSVLASAYASDSPQTRQSVIARVTPGGALDQSFGSGGIAMLDMRPKTEWTALEAMAVRADGSAVLAEDWVLKAGASAPNSPDAGGDIRTLSSTGQLVPDSAGQTRTPLPALADDYDFWLSSILPADGSLTLAGTRDSELENHQDRITLMRVGL